MLLFGNLKQINASNGAPGPITIPSTTTVYSRSFKLNFGQSFGVWVQAGNGSGAANMAIYLEQSYLELTEAQQGAPNVAWVIGDGVAPVYSNLNDTSAHIKTLSPVSMKYGRFKITGLGSNPADATVNIWIFIQELSG